MSDEEEVENELKDQFKGKKLNLNVRVDSKQFKEMVEKNVKLEDQLEAERTEKENLQNKLTIIAEQKFKEKKKALGAPDSIKTIEELKEWAKTRPSGLDLPISQRPSGSLKLTGAQTGETEGFDSYEQVVDFLVDLKHSGNPQERKQAKEILDSYARKTFDAMKKGEINKGEIFVDNPKERGESIIMKALRKKNEQIRKKAMERRGNE